LPLSQGHNPGATVTTLARDSSIQIQSRADVLVFQNPPEPDDLVRGLEKRMITVDRRVLSLNDVVRDASRLTAQKQSARADVRVRLDLETDLPPVLGDANQLLQVVVNLIGNAFDSVVGAGEIEIATAGCEGNVALRIADSGSGIASEHMPNLFDPCFTTKEEGKGAGLGLAVSYAIVQEHGGRITAQNRPTGGAEFLVTLPRSPATGDA